MGATYFLSTPCSVTEGFEACVSCLTMRAVVTVGKQLEASGHRTDRHTSMQPVPQRLHAKP